jgi:DNA topoisomerase-3
MDGIRKMSAFLVEYARDQAKPMAFPPDERRKKAGAKRGGGSTVIEGTVCPVCGKGKIRENSAAFGCTEAGCNCVIWKDCLTRGGGPVLTAKIVTMLLEKKELKGSTGTVALRDGKILFMPNGKDAPSVSRALVYERK